MMSSAIYYGPVLPWLFAPLKVEVNPAIWQLLRDNPGFKLGDRGGMTLVPR